jgi:alpha-beta hydrolase superfamily lysophospholipase
VIPRYFGRSDSLLYGVFDPAATPRLRRAMLLLNPGGWEYVRAHRTLRLLATRLSGAGIDVLRFDYSGTGDSWGDVDADITLDRWLDDAEEAADELSALAGVDRIGVLGLRLGARVALELAQRRAVRVERLALWDPIEIEQTSAVAAGLGRAEHPADEPSMELPGTVSHDLARITRAPLVPSDLRLMVALSDGSRVPSELSDVRAERTLRVAGSAPCWVEERDFGAGAVPTRLIEAIVTWARS